MSARKPPSPENKKIARHAAAAFGGAPKVQAYDHDHEPLSIALLSCADRPCEGVTAYSTVGLSDYPMIDAKGEEYPARLEIAGTCATENEEFANVLAAAAFCVIRTKRLLYPGAALAGYVREYFHDTTVPNLYFTAPFLWEETLKTLDCGVKKASWLLAVPISQSELEHLNQYGDDSLEKLFEAKQIDVFDLNRPSAIA